MSFQVIVLNGGSSTGKSSIAACLQTILPTPWLTFGTDTLVDAMPPSLTDAESGIGFGADGEVTTGEVFKALDVAWSLGIAAMVRAGARVIVDEVFLGGAASQQRWRKALDGLPVLWVGVRCDPDVAAAREAARGDRTVGMAASQALLVHEGVSYDLEVDTSTTSALECARVIAARVAEADEPQGRRKTRQ
ncbi:chloramphenicol phosphotransferase CPT [Actinopolymorpha rutila]|uniref:Chloramphenicol 3-O phosphotransferase n=1 Tax=Actinopolymorpha rutila TaxID=446787 RepID=A0A852ZCR3_9ACTN|nr:chloramphenicol phosphotransferase CPT [Actinopolymorpha rutila]NYH89965.1 chloramphenicol 3-O phosphotransferase [Actinopolymorpha rutila]